LLVRIQVEPASDDREGGRVDVGLEAVTDAVGAEAAVLRLVAER
jgi:hypothetical protein